MTSLVSLLVRSRRLGCNNRWGRTVYICIAVVSTWFGLSVLMALAWSLYRRWEKNTYGWPDDHHQPEETEPVRSHPR